MTLAKGTIFALKRFALHDGQGIRTTVFFKGCPLRCQWCHNPEGLKPTKELVFIKNNCIGCQRCLDLAGDDQISRFENNPMFNFSSPHDFKDIVKQCPGNAVIEIGQTVDSVELVRIIKDDQVFYQEKGGVTFSGGEPLLQTEFLKTVLAECRKANIHTALETSFYAPWNKINLLLEYLDTVYVDLKLFDPRKHLNYTGVTNSQILTNIKTILTGVHKHKVIIRTPLIPNISATSQNIEAIAKFISDCYPEVKYELLNYNYLAPAKYENLNRDFKLDCNLHPLDQNQLNELYHAATSAGIRHLISND